MTSCLSGCSPASACYNTPRVPAVTRLECLLQVLNATRQQLAEGKLPTVNPYHSLLTNFGAPLMLEIAAAHARHASEKVSSIAEDLRLVPPVLPTGGAGGGIGGGGGADGGRLRVGYIMADFRQHVTAHLLQTVFV